MKFKVLAGTHSEEGVEYKRNEIVESNRPLHEIFKAKFERLHDDTPTAVKPAAPVPKSKIEPVVETLDPSKHVVEIADDGYDVVNIETGVPVNSDLLTGEQVQKLGLEIPESEDEEYILNFEDLKRNQQVVTESDGEQFRGRITSISQKSKKFTVLFVDGDKIEYDAEDWGNEVLPYNEG